MFLQISKWKRGYKIDFEGSAISMLTCVMGEDAVVLLHDRQ